MRFNRPLCNEQAYSQVEQSSGNDCVHQRMSTHTLIQHCSLTEDDQYKEARKILKSAIITFLVYMTFSDNIVYCNLVNFLEMQ